VKYVLPLTHPLLALENISITLSGLKILDDVSIGVPEGAVTGLIGPNGAGKTTVFNIMSGFLTPDEGNVRFKGKKLKHIKTHHLTKLGISRTLCITYRFGKCNAGWFFARQERNCR
jgi:branched-chain amino acid transport system ATP-binding protein